MKMLGFDRCSGSVANACTDLIRRRSSGPSVSFSFSQTPSIQHSLLENHVVFLIKTTKRNISECQLVPIVFNHTTY